MTDQPITTTAAGVASQGALPMPVGAEYLPAYRAAIAQCGPENEQAVLAAYRQAMDEVKRLRRELAEGKAAPAKPDTLPAWLYQRFMTDGDGWDNLDSGQREYWEHQARAVRRAVARNGFKVEAGESR